VLPVDAFVDFLRVQYYWHGPAPTSVQYLEIAGDFYIFKH